MPKKSVVALLEMKRAGRKINWPTAYDYSMATFDVLGTFQAFTPKFVKKYADLAGVSAGSGEST